MQNVSRETFPVKKNIANPDRFPLRMQLGLWEMVSAGRGISESGGENARIRRNFSVAIISRICYNGDMETMRSRQAGVMQRFFRQTSRTGGKVQQLWQDF